MYPNTRTIITLNASKYMKAPYAYSTSSHRVIFGAKKNTTGKIEQYKRNKKTTINLKQRDGEPTSYLVEKLNLYGLGMSLGVVNLSMSSGIISAFYSSLFFSSFFSSYFFSSFFC